MFRFVLVIVALLAGVASPAQVAADGRAAHGFHRGVSLSNWLANARRQPIFERDFAHIREAGFDHVRLPVVPQALGFKLGAGNPTSAAALDFSRLDSALEMAEGQKLAVILDIHPYRRFMKTLEGRVWAEDQFVALWSALARRYKDRPDTLAFELLNEPQYYHGNARYRDLMIRTVAAVRKEDPNRWLVVGAPRGSSIKGLLQMLPLPDSRIIYAFHFYKPYIITHQGVRQGFEGMAVRYFRALPYPSRLADRMAADYAPGAPDKAKAASELAQYRAADWSVARIANHIREAEVWSKRHRVPVICSEFGVRRTSIDKASRYRWIGDVRAALDRSDIGWEIWDFSDLFGITRLEGKTTRPDPVDGSIRFVNPAAGRRVIEPEAIAALGLRPRGRPER